MCPRFLFVDTNNCAHKGHHPHSHTWSTHGRNRTLTALALRRTLNRQSLSRCETRAQGFAMPQRKPSYFSALPLALAEPLRNIWCRRPNIRKRCREPKEARALAESSVSSTGPLKKHFLYSLKQLTLAGDISVMATLPNIKVEPARKHNSILSCSTSPKRVSLSLAHARHSDCC